MAGVGYNGAKSLLQHQKECILLMWNIVHNRTSTVADNDSDVGGVAALPPFCYVRNEKCRCTAHLAHVI